MKCSLEKHFTIVKQGKFWRSRQPMEIVCYPLKTKWLYCTVVLPPGCFKLMGFKTILNTWLFDTGILSYNAKAWKKEVAAPSRIYYYPVGHLVTSECMNITHWHVFCGDILQFCDNLATFSIRGWNSLIDIFIFSFKFQPKEHNTIFTQNSPKWAAS